MVALLTGSVEVVFGAASLPGLTNLVPARGLVAGNRSIQVSLSVSALVGPLLAGGGLGDRRRWYAPQRERS